MSIINKENKEAVLFEYDWNIDLCYGCVKASCMKEAIQMAFQDFWYKGLSEEWHVFEIRIKKRK